ncbi:MAG: transporter substrate-binding domain-containing protein [Thermodesulfobacteriota bacterium]
MGPKKAFRVSLTLLLLLAVVLVRPDRAGAQERVLDVYFFDRAPYYIRPNNGRATGFLVEITRLILDRARVSYRLVEAPPKRILALLEQGEYAGSIGWFRTKEREAVVRFSRPIYQDRPLCLVINRDKTNVLPPRPTGEQVLTSGLSLGVISGFSYGDWADGLIKKFDPPRQALAVDMQKLFTMIARTRRDYTIVAPEEASYLLAGNPELAERLKVLRIADAPAGNLRHLIFSRRVEDRTLAEIDRAVSEVVGTEEYRELTAFPTETP